MVLPFFSFCRRFSRRPAAALLLLSAAAGCLRRPPSPAGDGGTEPRLVSLAPNLTEIVFAVGAGDRLAGRSDACDWPPAARRLPVAGGFGRPAAEAILALRPTCVLTTDLEDERSLAPLRRAGIAHHRIPCRRLDDIPAAMRAVGRLAGREEAGEEAAARLAAEIARLRAAAAAATNAPTVFVEIWDDPLITAGRRSFVAELVALAGGRNLGDELDAGYTAVSPEWVVRRDPEIILCLHAAGGDAAALRRVAARPGWRHLRAVREGRVAGDLDPDLLLRPGPRLPEGVAILRRKIAAATAADDGR